MAIAWRPAALTWSQLPSKALTDKETIVEIGSTSVPSNKIFDSNMGCPLVWQEVKSRQLWMDLMDACHADFVVDLSPGSGLTTRACGVPDPRPHHDHRETHGKRMASA